VREGGGGDLDGEIFGVDLKGTAGGGGQGDGRGLGE